MSKKLDYALNIGIGFMFGAVISALFVMDGLLKGTEHSASDVVIPLFAVGTVFVTAWALNEMENVEETLNDKH